MRITKTKIMSMIGLGLCMFSLSACQNNQQKQQQAQRSAQKQKVSLPTGNYFENDQKQQAFTKQQHRALNNVAKQMNNNYKKIGSTAYSQKENIILLSLHGTRTENTLKLAKQNKQAQKFWRELTQGFQKSDQNIVKSTKDPQLKLMIINNNQQQKPLYVVQNSKVLVNHLNFK